MTSFITPESKLTSLKNALDKLNPNQTQEKLLLFTLAANRIFSRSDVTEKVIEQFGAEEILKLSMDDFVKIVGEVVKKQPRKFIIFSDI